MGRALLAGFSSGQPEGKKQGMKMPVRGIPVLIAALLFVPVASAADKALRVAANTWPPYVDESLGGSGLAMEIVSTAFERAGYPIRVYIQSWPRTLEGARVGVYDVIAAAWYSDERAATLAFSKPYFHNEIRFLKRKGADIHYRQLSDLKGLLIGVVRDYAYGEAFNHSPDLVRVGANHVIQNLLRLMQGRIDLTLGDELVLRYQMKAFMPNAMQNLEFLPKPLERKGLHIAVSKENPAHQRIVADFDKALAQMRADGTWQRIVDSHVEHLGGAVDSGPVSAVQVKQGSEVGPPPQ